MKKILAYIYLAGFIGILGSCTGESFHPKDAGSGEGIKLTLSLSLPEMQSMQTRGVLDDVDRNPLNPSVDYLKSLTLYMFIFENTGSPESNYLLTLVHGDRINVTSTESDIEHQGQILQTFTANVEGTSENAIIHLVATSDPNFEDQLQETTDRTELGLFYGASGLYTKDEYPAFWKRIDLEMPITKDEEIVKAINEKLSHVQMIRNFCRVTVDIEEGYENPLGFAIDGFMLVNQVNAAYVAAYSDNEPRGFVEFEASDNSGSLTGRMKGYSDILVTDKYTPARHPVSVRAYKEEEVSSWLPAEGVDDSKIFSDNPKYMFERPYQEQHHTFVIIKGHFGSSADHRYIKLDIGDIPEWHFDEKQGFLSSAFEYRHLYRNFSYDIKINTIASEKVGSATAAGAVFGPAVNNVGATVETQSITDISDGVDRMYVNETKFIVVDDDNGDPYPARYDLMWRYVSNWKTSASNETQYIKYDYPGKELTTSDDSGIFGTLTPIANGDQWPDGWERDSYGGWSGMAIGFNRPDETIRQKTVRLYYSNPSTKKPNVRLSRDITFVMRKRWNFVTDDEYQSNIEVYPGAYSYENNTMPYESLQEMRGNITPGYVGSQRGAQLTVMFELPEDLPEALFPLDFKIGFDRQNVENAYAGNAVVMTGPSMFEDDPGGVGVMRMQFIKTVTWDYYHGDDTKPGHKIVTARFLTTNDVLDESGFSGVTSTTRVRITNPYFTLGQDDFERAAHDDVIDPTRTHWYWNFSYPEWGTYFNNYSDCANDPANWPNASEDAKDANPHDLNNLNFAGYSHGTKDDETDVSGTWIQIKSNLSNNLRSFNKPELTFPLEGKSETGLTANLIIKATPNKKRERGSYHAIPAGYTYYYYDRVIFATIITANYPNGLTVQNQNCDNPGGGDNLVLRTLNYSFNVEADDIVKEVRIWSGNHQYHTGRYDEDLNGETRYYSIEFTLTPKP